LLLILTSFVHSLHAQIKLTGGSKIKISSGTEIVLHTANDTLELHDVSEIENNGIIKFLNNSQVSEKNNHPIYGSGHEISILDTILIGETNPGNLGFEFNLSQPYSSRSIYRYHIDTLNLLNGFNSVKRYFKVVPVINNLSINSKFKIDSTELNGLNPSQLKMVMINSNSITNIGGNVDNDTLLVSQNTDSLTTFTLTAASIQIDTINKKDVCINDSIQIEFSYNGMLNPSTNFILFLSNGIDTIQLDTLSNVGTYSYLISDTIIAGLYNAYLQTTDINLMNIYDSTLQINNLPVISFTTSPSLCNNNDSLLLTIASPTGGIYSGIGTTNNYFYPNLIGTGIFYIRYSITDLNGCTSMDSTFITVNSAPSVTFASLPTLCENDTIYLLSEGTPSGGIYSGSSILNDEFNPAIGMGSYLLTYSFTDINNCKSSDTSTIQILSAPTIPIVTQTINTLTSSSATTYQWYLNGSPISGATNSTYDPTIEGSYQVEITDGANCFEISQPFDFFFNSVPENSFSNLISIYPNPANNYLFINLFEKQSVQISIFDNNGRLIISQTINQNTTIDLSNFANGLYFISASNNEFQKTSKLVVEK
jgi:hypothetical protein